MVLGIQRSISFTTNSTINNGVYRCGFAESQEAYDNAVPLLFDSLDKVSSACSNINLTLIQIWFPRLETQNQWNSILTGPLERIRRLELIEQAQIEFC